MAADVVLCVDSHLIGSDRSVDDNSCACPGGDRCAVCESQPDNEAEYGMRLLAANHLDQTSTALALDFTFDAQGMLIGFRTAICN